MKRVALVIACAVGCGPMALPRYSLAISATAPVVAKPASCDFRVVALPPATGFEEVATLTPETSSYLAGDPEHFKAAVRDSVCRAGGDVVVTEINHAGGYIRGTVLRAVQVPQADPPER